MRTVFWGPLKPSLSQWQDLSNPERLVFAGLVMLIVFYGLVPSVPLEFANPAIVEILDLLHPLP
jgi:NADH:ubiquinone oxidoreductase subunit 4 (subunit M)